MSDAVGLEKGTLGEDVDHSLRGIAAVPAVDGGRRHLGEDPLSPKEAVPSKEADCSGEDIPRLREEVFGCGGGESWEPTFGLARVVGIPSSRPEERNGFVDENFVMRFGKRKEGTALWSVL